ncbi:lipopolysaccharide biosynthesis protein [Haloarcula japonica]|uniref:lipopolysaccharide biosynthesis protein n=1 Tax=Haloarcula japonica TaxID=29282 RepID=UPI0039F733BF
MRSPFSILISLYQRVTDGDSTEEQTIHSGIWAAGINAGDRGLQLLKVVILARLLSPGAFGLLGISLLTLMALRRFSQFGIDQALIQHKNENVDEYLNTVWVMKFTRGTIIGLVAISLAPLIAEFFDEPAAEGLIRAIGISPIILGTQNPAVVYFKKNLNFHKEFAYQVGGRLMDIVAAVTFALIYGNVWALAVGIISSNATKTIISYIVHDFRPKFNFNLEYAKEMFGFGKWLLLSSILIFLYGQGDDAFIGWFFGASSLGIYQLAYRFSNAPATEVTHVISRVTFPAYSKVQDDVERLRQGYFQALKISAIISFPMVTGIVVIAPLFVSAILGPEWKPMVPLIYAMSIWGIIRSLGANIGPVFKAVGRPDYDTKIQVVKVIFIGLFIYPAAEAFGTVGVVYTLVGSAVLTMPILYYLSLSIVNGELSRLVTITVYPAIGSATMFAFLTYVKRNILRIAEIVQIPILILLGIAAYTAIMLIFDKYLNYDTIGFYHSLRNAVQP